jgi:hypothetical protein
MQNAGYSKKGLPEEITRLLTDAGEVCRAAPLVEHRNIEVVISVPIGKWLRTCLNRLGV